MRLLLTIGLLYTSILVFAQHPHKHNHSHEHNRVIEFPDVEGYLTLTADLHQHTVFSDGYVWPRIRVEEGLRDSLDVMAISDHLEYQPHKKDIPHPDRNRSYDIAAQEVEKRKAEKDIILVRAAEVTKAVPLGHSNALFLEDVNKIMNDDPMVCFTEARNQGAFVFWNHPWYQRKDGIAYMVDTHMDLIKKKLIHGIEITNGNRYSVEALQIALDYNLTLMGTSDIHGLIDWSYDVHNGGHRDVTLIFAKEKTQASIKEALFDRRTAVWSQNKLIGRPEHLNPLLTSSMNIRKVELRGDSSSRIVQIEFENKSDAHFILENKTEFTFTKDIDIIQLPPHAITTISVKTIEKLASFDLDFEVLNAITAPHQHPEITFKIKVPEWN